MFVVLGGNGYVGTAFQKHLTLGEIPFQVVSRADVNYADRDSLLAYLKSRNPEFLINAAGFTGKPNVDACEVQKTACLEGNAVLPGVIREVCEHLGIPWGHVSSGCIYTGSKPNGDGFLETDAPNFSFRQNNCSFYSGCKALGEEMLDDAADCYVWRLRIPFNEFDSPRNYISKMIGYERLLDATNSLSHLDQFVRACVACWTQRVDFGTYNLTNPGAITTREVVEMISKHGLTQKSFSFFDSEEEFMRIAASTPRSNCVLDSSRAIAAELKMAPVEDALEHALSSWTAAPAAASS